MIPTTFRLVLFSVWALGANCAAVPRQGFDANSGTTLLRRETSETESSVEASDGRASIPVTSEIHIGDIDSELLARYGLPASSEHAPSSSEKAATSLEERGQQGKSKQRAHGGFKEELQTSHLSSTLWRRSKTGQTPSPATPSPTVPGWSKTTAQSVDDVMNDSHGGWVNGDGSAEFTIHSCVSNGDCNFADCINSGANTVRCSNGNCFSTNDGDTTGVCASQDDGTDVNDGDAFCLGEKPTKICPPSSCVDIDNALAGTTCSELKTNDPDFCTNATLSAMVELFCRYTCGVCTLATCGDADGSGPNTGVGTCPLYHFNKNGVASTVCDDVVCDMMSSTSPDTSKCCQACDDAGTSQSECQNQCSGYHWSGGICQAYNCITGSGSGECKTCQSQDLRTANNHCSSCNPGDGLSMNKFCLACDSLPHDQCPPGCKVESGQCVDDAEFDYGAQATDEDCEEGDDANSSESNSSGSNSSSKKNCTKAPVEEAKEEEKDDSKMYVLVGGVIIVGILIVVCLVMMRSEPAKPAPEPVPKEEAAQEAPEEEAAEAEAEQGEQQEEAGETQEGETQEGAPAAPPEAPDPQQAVVPEAAAAPPVSPLAVPPGGLPPPPPTA